MRVKVSPHLVMVTEDYKVFSGYHEGENLPGREQGNMGGTESGDNLFRCFLIRGKEMG